MKEEKVFPLIVKMSLPMVVSMLVNSMYNIVDSFFVAKISENAMTAPSLVFPVQNLINAVMIGFGVFPRWESEEPPLLLDWGRRLICCFI